MTRLRIVIVNWNTGDLLRDCLASIVRADCTGFVIERVVVVDNASTDDSLSGISDLKLPLEIIRNRENRGFAAACNQGAQNCSADYILFLNPDTRLYADSLTIPIAFMHSPENAKIGICGIQLIGDDGLVARTCARFPSMRSFIEQSIGLDKLLPGLFRSHLMSEWDHLKSRQVDHVIGAFYLIRADLFLRLTGFDERFFVYLEDLDLSLRVYQEGYASWYLVETRAYHKGGGSSERVKARRLFYSCQSKILYAFKHFFFWQALLVALVTLCVEPLVRSVYCSTRGAPMRCIMETLAGFAMLYRALPDTIRRAWRH